MEFAADVSWDLPSLAPGATALVDVTVNGAQIGYLAQGSLVSSTRFIELDAAVWSNNTVRVIARNISAATFNLASAICGAESCVDMAEFGLAKEPLFRQVLRLNHGIPSHDTFSRLFRLLDPAAFHTAFQRFMAAFAEAATVDGVIALDGKTARRSFDRARSGSPLHLVSAWACDARLVLGQRAVAEGGNEIDALLELLAMLDLEGRIVTADAMHCQRRTAKAVLERRADYVLALKATQRELLADVRLLLDDPQAPPESEAQTMDGDHGRIETRRASVLADIDYLQRAHSFPGLAAIARITASREISGKTSTAVRYFLLSRPMTAERLLAVVRAHWGIENSLHWVLDVIMDEDQARTRRDHGPENLALLRRLALNMLRANTAKGSVRLKIKRAGWRDDFLLSILAQLR